MFLSLIALRAYASLSYQSSSTLQALSRTFVFFRASQQSALQHGVAGRVSKSTPPRRVRPEGIHMIEPTFGGGWRTLVIPLLLTSTIIGGALTYAFTS